MSLEELLRGYCALLKRVHDWPAFEARLEGLISRMEKIPPLMPRFKGLSLQRFVKFVFGNLVNAAGRRDMFRQLNDPHAREVKNRLMKLVPGKSPRERYLRSYIEDAVDRQWNMVNYTLPDVLRSVTDELEQLSVHGLPPLEPSTYSVPDSFREPYKVVFPSVHDRVQRTLSDKSRAEVVLVEVFHDFLTRWGPTFKGLEDYHEMQLVEICDRAVAKVNGTSHPDSVTSEHWVRVERDANSGIADLKLRRLATEVLRCVDDEFRRHKDGPALAVRGA